VFFHGTMASFTLIDLEANDQDNYNNGMEDMDEDEEEFAIEEIVRFRKDKKGERVYLVKWEGYEDKHNTWEPEVNLPILFLCNFWEKFSQSQASNKGKDIHPKSQCYQPKDENDQKDQSKARNDQKDQSKARNDQKEQSKARNDQKDQPKAQNDQKDQPKTQNDQKDQLKAQNDQKDRTKAQKPKDQQSQSKDQTGQPYEEPQRGPPVNKSSHLEKAVSGTHNFDTKFY